MRKSMCILALSDDMTGALEVGAKFSAAGIDTVVWTRPAPLGSMQAIVFDTETRHLHPTDAGRIVSTFVTQCGVRSPQLVYKKTDSTLRGNISAELQSLAQIYPDWRIGYAPAYPALGRTVKSGVLYVHGIPVAETEFGSDVLNPISVSSVAAILEPKLPCTIFDGETEADVTEAARAMLSDQTMRILAGPAGLAERVAEAVDLPRRSPLPLPLVRSCLVMNGSRHERSAAQMRQVQDGGWHALASQATAGADPALVAAQNATFVVEQIAAKEPDAVFLIGGDTAFAFIKALGVPSLQPIAEVLPGVPVARIAAEELGAIPGRNRDLYLITKAGGFGGPDTLAVVRGRLSPA
jgi:D-threonate/D-erythronate kinase